MKDEDNDYQETNATANQNEENQEIMATNLQAPWAISMHGGTFFITEREGEIVKLEDKSSKRENLKLKEKLLVYGEGGLMGMALHPDFADNRLAYIYHTYGTEEKVRNRIILVKYNGTEWTEEKMLLDDIPGAIFHNGGRLKIGPDQKLYATVGDANIPESAQDITTLSGSILRMNLDGTIPDDNPFDDSYIYSYGHRNPQGLTWDEANDTMYASEHGPSGYDEINKIEAGNNYGWPHVTGDEKREGMQTPLFHSGKKTWAPSGLGFHNGNLYVASLRGEQIRKLNLESMSESVAWNNDGRIRDVWIESDTLFFISNNTDGRGNPRKNDDILMRLPIQ